MPSGRNGETAKKRPLSALEDPEINARQPPPQVLAPQSSPSQQAPRPPNPLLTPISPTEILTSFDHWIRMFHDLPDPNSNAPSEAPSSKAKDQLVVFAGKSEEERARIVDEMVCECLRNENFGTFVDAVEGSWRRVGLGL